MQENKRGCFILNSVYEHSHFFVFFFGGGGYFVAKLKFMHQKLGHFV